MTATLTPDLAATGWEDAREGKAIAKIFRFRNFRDAMAWMTRVAFEAEAANHHPEWFNVYNRVEVVLTTHDTGGLTDKDIALAEKMDKIAAATYGK
ncbi:4a-hydroxytetrahydrobiopterin dehydratase [Rhodobacteraceae bacterium NNCM2]|nr:4a-hydroxytetrahydrobiopterin dehydratase [Coraliihabitans acroporae]